MLLLAHRGLLDGPNEARENRLETIEAAFAAGFGIETDLRLDAQRGFYVSHNLSAHPSEWAVEHADAWNRSGRTIALNIKEPDQEESTLEFLDGLGALAHCVLFDMELCERESGTSAKRIRSLCPQARLLARASDRNEPLEQALAAPGEGIWLDEFDGPWIQAGHIEQVHAAGKTAWMVLPDLHGKSREETLRRLEQFRLWGADVACTDWTRAADRHLRDRGLV